MSVNGNTDIYRISIDGGTPTRLTNAPGIDIGGSFSPDGSKIVFESDRSGTQQLYVMKLGRIGPAPDQLRRRPLCHAGMEPARRSDRLHQDRRQFPDRRDDARGGGERLLTNSWQDEAPTWSPNGRVIQFFRTSQGRGGRSSIWQVDLTGVNERQIQTTLDGSDPAWGPILP